MLKLGAPIFAVGMLTVAFDSAGRTLVLLLHPTEILGYYGMAQMFAGMMRLIPQAAQFVLGPQDDERLGRFVRDQRTGVSHRRPNTPVVLDHASQSSWSVRSLSSLQ